MKSFFLKLTCLSLSFAMLFALGCNTETKPTPKATGADKKPAAEKENKTASNPADNSDLAVVKKEKPVTLPAKGEAKTDTKAPAEKDTLAKKDVEKPVGDKPAKLNARTVLADAMTKAKSENKKLVVRFSADWCGWCHKMADFLKANEELFEKDYLFVTIQTDHMQDGEEVLKETRKGRSGGIPWFAILDGDGKELITSVGPKGNIGCPVESFEIDHFVEMIKTTSDADEDHLKKIREALQANAKKIRG